MIKLKWLINDLGLNELDAWWRLIWTAALVGGLYLGFTYMALSYILSPTISGGTILQ